VGPATDLEDWTGIAPSGDYAHLENWTIDYYKNDRVRTYVYESKKNEALVFRADYDDKGYSFTTSDGFGGDLFEAFSAVS
jgi:hypothetical protein